MLALGKGHFVDGVQNFLNMIPEKLNSIGGPNDDVPFGTNVYRYVDCKTFFTGKQISL